MSDRNLSFNHFTAEQKGEFKRLTSTPKLAWPTFCMWIALNAAFFSSYYLCGSGRMSLWWGMLLNSVVGYVAFSVVHDSLHRAISTHVKLNDWIGQLALVLVAPYVSLKLFRWGHVLHHRFANGPADPDRVLNGAWWTLPFRWVFIDGFYLIYAITKGDKVSRPFLIQSYWFAAIFLSFIGTLTALGYGLDVLMLWFIPSRVIFVTLGFSFFWLPHVPHDVEQEHNFTRATTIREGAEWLMGPVLQNQNYHLIHHLYPMTPFYNNHRVWYLLEPELRKKELAIQQPWAIKPQIHPPGVGSVNA